MPVLEVKQLNPPRHYGIPYDQSAAMHKVLGAGKLAKTGVVRLARSMLAPRDGVAYYEINSLTISMCANSGTDSHHKSVISTPALCAIRCNGVEVAYAEAMGRQQPVIPDVADGWLSLALQGGC
jgi:hypothetical protein